MISSQIDVKPHFVDAFEFHFNFTPHYWLDCRQISQNPGVYVYGVSHKEKWAITESVMLII